MYQFIYSAILLTLFSTPIFCTQAYNYTTSSAPHLACPPSTTDCDGVPECEDGSDERCCPAGWATCYNGVCFNETKRCDKVQECNNNFDELLCSDGLNYTMGPCQDSACSHELVVEGNLKMCLHLNESECSRTSRQQSPGDASSGDANGHHPELCDLHDPHASCPSGGSRDGESWGYGASDGPSTWPTTFPEYCAGEKQSPIDIDVGSSTKANPGPISVTNWEKSENGKITNNGHSLVFQFKDQAVKPTASGGRLGKLSYDFLQLHFHWGKDPMSGSEHTRGGTKFPLEMHMVHVLRENFNPLNQSPTGLSYGLAVLGFFFEVTAGNNTRFAPIIDAIDSSKTTGKGLVADVNDIKLEDFVGGGGVGDVYYYYSGGLTTPKCNEAVLWTVYDKAIPISEVQLSVFSNFEDGKLSGNFRPPQPLNGRRVWKRDPSLPLDNFVTTAQLYGYNLGIM